jgi:hypothetical protein
VIDGSTSGNAMVQIVRRVSFAMAKSSHSEKEQYDEKEAAARLRSRT